MKSHFIKTAIVLAATVLTAGGAMAQSPMQEQRKDQVQDRIQDTNQRINQEYRAGNLSRGEARELKHENREIAQDARQQARDGGGLSRGEQRDINQDQNQLNKQITRESR